MKHQIEWVETRESESGRDHGVEFLYEARPGRAAAFIVGYEWMHRPGQQPVRVEIWKALSKTPEIEEEVREAVEAFPRVQRVWSGARSRPSWSSEGTVERIIPEDLRSNGFRVENVSPTWLAPSPWLGAEPFRSCLVIASRF